MAHARLAAILIGLVATIGILDAADERNQIYPGLGENSWVMDLTRDQNGLIWVASARGVFRFDGMHYHAIPGYPFPDAQFMAADAEGGIWAGGSHGLTRYERATWKVVSNEPVQSMAMGHSGLWVLFGGRTGGLRLISTSGVSQSFSDAKPTGDLVVDSEEAVWFPCGQRVCTMRAPNWLLESQANPAPGNWKKVVPEKGGSRLWVSSADEVAVVRNGVVEDRQKAESGYRLPVQSKLLDPYLSPSGTVWGTRLRMQPRAGWRLSQTEGQCSYFVDEFTQWFCIGWAAAKSVSEPDWETWRHGVFTSASPEGFLAVTHRSPLLFSNRGVFELSDGNEWVRPRDAAKLAVVNMIGDSHGGYWLATKDEGLVRAGKDFTILERFRKSCPDIDSMRGFLRDGRGRMWVGGKSSNCFFEVQGEPGKWKFVPENLPEGTLETVDLKADVDGRPWVGYEHGIAYLDDSGDWKKITTSEPITSVRALEFDGKDAIWVARRRGPAFFARLERRGNVWQVRRFAGPQFGPSETFYLRRDSRGWVWRGTASEVQIARPGRYEPEEWLRIRNDTGLASVGVNLRGWIEDASGNVWLAGNGGVTRVRPTAEWFATPNAARPLVTRLKVGDRSWLDPNQMPKRFSGGRGPIEIDLSSMDANPFLKSPLRYRLAPFDTAWKLSPDGRLRFDKLKSGSYTLEAAYTGDGTPQVMRWEFQIGSPTWAYFVTALELASLGLLVSLAWWRREWLQYWVRKPLFVIGQRLHQDEESVTWTNYTGRVLERYDFFESISRSDFSVTYVARHLETAKKVVVKVLHRKLGQERPMRQRFAQEVAALHTLSHPGLVRLLDSWISPEGEPCLVMEYLEGPTLRQLLIEEGPLTPARVANILAQLGAAVGAIHEHGIVHRDLKPENVIVREAGTSQERAVIIDFGSSASRGPVKDQENTITLTGSLHYIAPERLGRQYSPASDVYSLGVMVLEMGSGKRPAEMDVTPLEPEFVHLASAWAGEAAARTLTSALQHQPSRRPSSVTVWAEELAQQLRDFSERRRDASPST